MAEDCEEEEKEGDQGGEEDVWCPLERLEEHNLEWVIQRIILFLDLASLHVARQVCKRWDSYVMRLAWTSKRGRKYLENCLRNQWTHEEPHRRSWLLPRTKGFYLAAEGSTLGLGTIDNRALMIQEGSTIADLECQDLAAVARELEEQMRNVGGGNFISEEGSVQLDMTKDIIVTVTGCGVVTMWSRKTFLPLYRNHHHGYEPVLGVRCLADLVVTGGIQGSMAVFTVKDEEVTLESLVEEPGQTSINHLDVQGDHVLVGTDRDMRLWGVEDRTKPKLLSTVPAEHVCCCVLFYPQAACTGLILRPGLQIWDMVRGVPLRHLHPNHSMWVVAVKGDLLATSTSTVAGEEHSIFIHSTTELSRGASPGEAVWERRLVCNTEDEADPHIALTKTCLFAVSRERRGARISCWDFWSYNRSHNWDSDTFLEDIDIGLLL